MQLYITQLIFVGNDFLHLNKYGKYSKCIRMSKVTNPAEIISILENKSYEDVIW